MEHSDQESENAKADKKYKYILDTLGIGIYMNCGQSAKDMQEEEVYLNLEGDKGERDFKEIIRKFRNIAGEAQNDRATREIQLI